VWAVTCFVVRVGHRRRGVASALLDGAVDLARRHGAAVVEGYPVDTSARKASSAELYHGPLSVFGAAGFTEVARPSPARAVVRRTV
jgi:GNAT superfamily N-acetyltransferase